jgi:hypothetical protein
VDLPEDWLDDGRSGQFDSASRTAATTAAMPLLASYFATGADTLRSQTVLSVRPDDELGDLLEFIQIRVLLAAAEELEPLLRGILERPSFRYRRVREESVGVIRGRLDTVTYLRRRHEVTAPRRFPVINVVRSHNLPENVLGAWAALALSGALKRLPLHRIPPEAPERRRAERASESLRRLANHAAFTDCVDAAAAAWRTGSHRVIVERALSRIRSGRVPNATNYEALAHWVDSYNPAEIALDPGTVPWLFYNETFDTRLFELWCLHYLIDALTTKLGPPTSSRLLVDRSGGAIAAWSIGAVTVEVWFQAGLVKTNVGDPRWTYEPRERDTSTPTGPFGGIPDITVVVQQPGQPRRPIILDPKLRQRRSVPGGEIYKVLGYFGNVPSGHPNRGVILFHGPKGSQRSYRISDGGSGEILAVAVDPLDHEDASDRFDDLAAFIIESIPGSTMTRALGPTDPDSPDSIESWVDSVQTQAVAEMASAISPDSLERSRKALRANLLTTWDKLDDDTQRMLATAEHFGGGVTPDMDHSGPLLGLAAGCERLLRVFMRGLGVSLPEKLTLGQMLRVADDACQGDQSATSTAVRAALVDRGIDLAGLHDLIVDLFVLNADFRIPAAHADVLEEDQWFRGRAAILLGSDAALPRVVRVLGL